MRDGFSGTNWMWVVVLSCTVCSLSPITELRGQPTNQEELALYPLRKGLTWETNNSDKQWSLIGVTDTVKWNMIPCYEISLENRDGKLLNNRVFITVKDDGWYRVGGDNSGLVYTYEPPECILKPPSAKVQRWTNKYTSKSKILNLPNSGSTEVRSSEYVQSSTIITYQGKNVEATMVEADSKVDKKRTWYIAGKGPVRWKTYRKDIEKNRVAGENDLEKEGWKLYENADTTRFSGNVSAITIGDVVLGKNQIEKEASSESVEAVAGVVTEFERSRTINREIGYSTKIGAGAEVELKIAANLLLAKGDLTTKVRGCIEKETGEKLTASETRKQTIKIDGNLIQKAKIVWIDIYRTGSIEVTHDGKMYTVPFEFPIGTRLVIRKQ